jgi:hypothetical protein
MCVRDLALAEQCQNSDDLINPPSDRDSSIHGKERDLILVDIARSRNWFSNTDEEVVGQFGVSGEHFEEDVGIRADIERAIGSVI